MNYFLTFTEIQIFLTLLTDTWIPSQGFLFIVLVFGAFLTGGVALSVLTFYEDHYWNDKQFRDDLRFDSSRRDPSESKASHY